MKKFTCNCIKDQFKASDKVFVEYNDEYIAEIPCIYVPNEKVNLRKVRLKTNYCPMCGAKLEEINNSKN
ncbi:hypothetical protein [Anaerovorax odorimutans]|uniref:hypothetical protein n=1 Tax=Anaerovorax odorimutans TaxID=109327 RepID=UPI0004270E70|nr:hypothetical protein [Anaerovorax odorimutans]